MSEADKALTNLAENTHLEAIAFCRAQSRFEEAVGEALAEGRSAGAGNCRPHPRGNWDPCT